LAWREELTRAMPSANIPTLLMVLVHLTGDTYWLTEKFQCSRIRGLDDNDSGGLPEEVQNEVRAAALEAILARKDGRPAALPAPETQLLVDMLRLSVGEPVAESYGPMLAGWLGLDADLQIEQKHAFQVPSGYHAVIIGAGVAGICMAIRLQGAGIPYTVIEKNGEVGGTWYENQYPGAGVDKIGRAHV